MKKKTVKKGGGIYSLGIFISTRNEMMPRVEHSRDQRWKNASETVNRLSKPSHQSEDEGTTTLHVTRKSPT